VNGTVTGYDQEAPGHRVRPYPAGVLISAWAPTAEDCLAEAVRAVLGCFADVHRAVPSRLLAFACDPAPAPDLLLDVLGEVISLIEAYQVPVQVAVASTGDGGLVGEFGVVDRSALTPVGPAPRSVRTQELFFERQDGAWRCQVAVEV
jgi:SHS2 domain-containing protein